ncbi:Ornithine carbamoyltransferase, catabolic [Aquabacterium sp. CECT 9606]|nr:Ornithine carbamoyltransferase, catabolic [Aquabacterium sp. CECT 9606]
MRAPWPFNVSIYLDYKALNAPDGLNEDQLAALRCVADSLTVTGAGGTSQMLLRDKNIAVVCGQSDLQDASLFERAATSLGARVARIRSSDAGLAPGADLIATAKMLGRLYEAIECQGVAPEVIAQLEQHAGIVVFNALGSPRHQAFIQFDRTRHDALARDHAPNSDEAGREAFIQAVLLSTLR